MLNQNRNYELTAKELRTFKGFESVSEDEATEICFHLRELSLILYDVFQIEINKRSKRETFLNSLKQIKPMKHEKGI